MKIIKTVIEMAREAGLHRQQHNLMSNPVQYRFSYDGYEENLERFANLVRADERNRTWTQDHWTEYERSIAAQERQRIVNLLMVQHDMAKRAHNYWHVAAQLIQADVASNT